ncbi:MAG TPA: hypothetical protein VLE19_07625 [Pyrinomonadaceae bacterium]|nr:hypothetical protein [Pyrinomonadaceae bacterium]
MSVPIRRPIASDTSSSLDEFVESQNSNTTDIFTARTLKPPPEIWELVHPIPQQEFKPGKALASRLAGKNVFVLAIAIVLTSGVGVASWKLQIPQSVVAIFTAPDVPAKKMVPATLNRSAIGATKTNPNSVATSNEPEVNQPDGAGLNSNAVQVPSAVSKSSTRKTSKLAVGTGTPRVKESAADKSISLTTTLVRPRTVAKTLTQHDASVPASNMATPNATSSSSIKSKSSTPSSAVNALPPKPNPEPKAKVIHWP